MELLPGKCNEGIRKGGVVFRLIIKPFHRSSRPKVHYKKIVLKVSKNTQENILSVFLNKFSGWTLATLLKKGSDTGVLFSVLQIL